MSKPTVRYIDVQIPIIVGRPTLVLPLDHPSTHVSNRRWAQTTAVQSQRPGVNGPVFETRNTTYIAAETDESLPRATHQETKVT
jgi:hypothetical protein